MKWICLTHNQAAEKDACEHCREFSLLSNEKVLRKDFDPGIIYHSYLTWQRSQIWIDACEFVLFSLSTFSHSSTYCFMQRLEQASQCSQRFHFLSRRKKTRCTVKSKAVETNRRCRLWCHWCPWTHICKGHHTITFKRLVTLSTDKQVSINADKIWVLIFKRIRYKLRNRSGRKKKSYEKIKMKEE